MEYNKNLFAMLLISVLSLFACDGGDTTECTCADGVCDCPADYGLEKTEVSITYSLNDGREASKAGMEVEGTCQLMYENVEPQPIKCLTKTQDTENKLQCSLGKVAVGSEIRFMVMVPVGDEMVVACQTPNRSDCRGILEAKIIRENGKSEILEDMLVTDGDFAGLVAYRIRITD